MRELERIYGSIVKDLRKQLESYGKLDISRALSHRPREVIYIADLYTHTNRYFYGKGENETDALENLRTILKDFLWEEFIPLEEC